MLTAAVSRVPASDAADKTHINSIGMEFLLIPAGSFLMGSPDGDRDAPANEN